MLATLPDESVNCCVTSPPYFGLRDYGVDGQIGLEDTPAVYIDQIVAVFREVWRVLRDDGTLWLNLGDSYAGSWGAQSREHAGKHSPNVSALSANQVKAAHIRDSGTGSLSRTPGLKAKDLIGIPWRVAFALQADGWYLRQDIIWSKPNPMPESVRDRCTRSHEYIFMLSKSRKYYYDAEAVKEPAVRTDQGAWSDKSEKQRGHSRRHSGFNGRYAEKIAREGAPQTRNRRSVWTVPPKPFKAAHFATFPPDLIRPCILAGCPVGGTVLDPFFGSGTTGLVANAHGRNAIGIELNTDYIGIAEDRLGLAPYATLLRQVLST
ncbi:MAG: site-specific DNA-methyltransferase [Mesorhizobium sp.]|nr:MAG: site-specific DNA-methyltransferase [Mesorhizobium sp.]